MGGLPVVRPFTRPVFDETSQRKRSITGRVYSNCFLTGVTNHQVETEFTFDFSRARLAKQFPESRNRTNAIHLM